MINKKDLNGNMIMVSEGVDVDDINFEQMIDNPKSEISKITEALQNTLINVENAQNKKEPTERIAIDNEKQEHIWIQFSFIKNNAEVLYSGILTNYERKNNIHKFSIKIDRPQAIEYISFLNGHKNNNIEIKSIICVFEQKEEKIFEKINQTFLNVEKIILDDDCLGHFINMKIHLNLDF